MGMSGSCMGVAPCRSTWKLGPVLDVLVRVRASLLGLTLAVSVFASACAGHPQATLATPALQLACYLNRIPIPWTFIFHSQKLENIRSIEFKMLNQLCPFQKKSFHSMQWCQANTRVYSRSHLGGRVADGRQGNRCEAGPCIRPSPERCRVGHVPNGCRLLPGVDRRQPDLLVEAHRASALCLVCASAPAYHWQQRASMVSYVTHPYCRCSCSGSTHPHSCVKGPSRTVPMPMQCLAATLMPYARHAHCQEGHLGGISHGALMHLTAVHARAAAVHT